MITEGFKNELLSLKISKREISEIASIPPDELPLSRSFCPIRRNKTYRAVQFLKMKHGYSNKYQFIHDECSSKCYWVNRCNFFLKIRLDVTVLSVACDSLTHFRYLIIRRIQRIACLILQILQQNLLSSDLAVYFDYNTDLIQIGQTSRSLFTLI